MGSVERPVEVTEWASRLVADAFHQPRPDALPAGLSRVTDDKPAVPLVGGGWHYVYCAKCCQTCEPRSGASGQAVTTLPLRWGSLIFAPRVRRCDERLSLDGTGGVGLLTLWALFVAVARIFDLDIAGVYPEAWVLTAMMTAPFTIGTIAALVIGTALVEKVLRRRRSAVV